MKRILLASPLLLVACATVPVETPIPANLVPGGERVVEHLGARGVQIYECRAKAGGGMEWAFVAPRADLIDTQGRPAGKHYAGPLWEAPDGSKILGTVRTRADAPEVGAIQWLLLSARSVGAAGRYSSVTSVQRINTMGGVAPALPCDAGAKREVPYAADYILFSSAGSSAPRAGY